jgi:alginate O-acetyltransferase complex protein AlgI
MLFQSAGFLFLFLPVFLLAMYLSPAGPFRSLTLLLFSYLFYSGAEPFFVLLLLASSLTDYIAALRLHRASRPLVRRLWLFASITVNLGLLSFYKYGAWLIPKLAPFLADTGIPVPDANFFAGIIMPAGISFYTFQSMSYTFDVYRRQVTPERNLLGFCNYVAYLPQLIAGPIERFGHLAPQLRDLTLGLASPQWSVGMDRILLGVAQKLLIADSCGMVVDRVLGSDVAMDFATAWAVAVGFGMQIYYDFAAYTHIAIGISLLLGVRLQENFNSPYQAADIQEFWRRWHMTLSRWFRDYVYIPLGGSRNSLTRTTFNILVTFLLVGFWHGAGWNYLAWGVLHGVMLAGFRIKQALLPGLVLHRYLAMAVTLVCVHFAWVPFRVGDTVRIADIWAGMAGMHGFSGSLVSNADLVILGLVLAGTLLTPNASKRWPGSGGWQESAAIASIAGLAVITTPDVSKFIYFQF